MLVRLSFYKGIIEFGFFFFIKNITYCVTTLALGLQPKQGLARLWAKKEVQESHLMLLGMQKSVRE
jgi:hypothetical protein